MSEALSMAFNHESMYIYIYIYNTFFFHEISALTFFSFSYCINQKQPFKVFQNLGENPELYP